MNGFLDDLEDPRRRRPAPRLPSEKDEEHIPITPFVPFRCGHCGAARPKPETYGVRGRRRFHRCRVCKTLYRSLEIEESDPKAIAEAILRLFG